MRWKTRFPPAMLLVAGCSATGGDGGQAVATLPAAPYVDLLSLARDLPIPLTGSERFVAPTAAELTAFSELLAVVTAGHYADGATRATGLGYDLMRVEDPAAATLVVLTEKPAGFRGGGTFVVNPGARGPLIVEVPHPLSDAGTLEEGVKLFVTARARLLMIAGTHRCADNGSTPCRGTEATNACGGRLRVSDAAHYTGAFFHTAHVFALQSLPTSAAISLHAHAAMAGEPDAMVGHGTRQALGATAIANRLRDTLRAMGLTAASCNLAADPPPRLCGDANVQGRASNGAADACADDASATSGRFLHVEQSPTILADTAAVVNVLSSLLAPSGS